MNWPTAIFGIFAMICVTILLVGIIVSISERGKGKAGKA